MKVSLMSAGLFLFAIQAQAAVGDTLKLLDKNRNPIFVSTLGLLNKMTLAQWEITFDTGSGEARRPFMGYAPFTIVFTRLNAAAGPRMVSETGRSPALVMRRGNSCIISIVLAKQDETEVSVFDSRGKLVRMLCKSRLDAGTHEIAWDGSGGSGGKGAPGIYQIGAAVGGVRRAVSKVFIAP
jgi:hypothetical protein